jgi:hypothetical protein
MTPQEKKELDYVLKTATKVLIGTIILALVLLTITIIKL